MFPDRTAPAHPSRLPRLRALVAVVAIAATPAIAASCASDDSDDDDVVPVEEPDVPVDLDVDDGVDTEVEQSGNLGFDEEPPDLDGDVRQDED